MTMRTITLEPWALTELPTAMRVIGDDAVKEDGDEALLAMCVNQASADIEAFCGRRLKSRAYAGDTALRVRGDGARALILPEYPPTAITKISWKDKYTGALTDLDLTAMDFWPSGRVETPEDVVPMRYTGLVECVCGYLAGHDSDHDRKLIQLEGVCLRLTLIRWQDYAKKIGRRVEARMVQGMVSYTPTEMPPDLQQSLAPLRRL